ncbi:MAG: type IIL restriction-modification enzyme MmeI [Kiritimatiellia bacterium]
MESEPQIANFIARWQNSGAAERANYQLFLSELCDLIGVPRPDPAGPDDSANAYVFERNVTFQHGDGTTSTGRIDLYKRACLVLEAKQGANPVSPEKPLSEAAQELKRKLKLGSAKRGSGAWDDAMLRARGQAEQYCRALPASEGRPPFIAIVDVGHSIELFAEFSCTGGTYTPFPAAGSHRLFLADLARPEIRERLRLVWTAPHDLDPARRSARVTREIAASLARLAVSLEKAGHDPHTASTFLMRALFTMFAEDVGLLMRGGFSNLLQSLRDTPEHFTPMVQELWQRMNTGGFSTSLRTAILQFNGGLFENAAALPMTQDQLLLLIEASQSDWRDVEPAIFGTLLERALDPVERHKLGAHYTPRAYVERLVLPAIVQPVRADWEAVHAAAVLLATTGDLKKAAATVKTFHQSLCHLRILDPACGTGNFLYVTLEHLKRIEGEVFDTLAQLGERQAVLEYTGETVGPHQFFGLEVNPRAAAIAELVLWIGTLQWHFRNRGNVAPPQPIIRNFHNIQCRDALIDYDGIEPVLDAEGKPVTRWDGRTTKPHPVTGREVPDDSARAPVVRYLNPRPAQWPEVDYVIGNPPFIGPALMRQALGDGYTETVRAVHADVGESSDFVMYWWNHAAKLARAGSIQRFGFVTTNSLRQTFNRRVLETQLASDPPLSILLAIPDHPWVDAADGAAVRIAMTVAAAGKQDGVLNQVLTESETDGDHYAVTFATTRGHINADLTTGADVAGAVELKANTDISNRGFELGSDGFIVTPEEAATLGLGRIAGLDRFIRLYRNGRDLTSRPRDVMCISLFDISEDQLRSRYPEVYQWLFDRVRPERAQNRDKRLQLNWWLHRRSREDLRNMLGGRRRYIATVETSKHRFFVFLDKAILPDNKLICIALEDAFHLGVLSSRIHVAWVLAAGSTLEDRPVYVKTTCFETFPFPVATDAQKARIRELAEQLDAHRKRQQSAHEGLTITGMYNVLEKLRSGEPLTAAEKKIHEEGLVSVLKQLHDDLDAAVFESYGWPPNLNDAQILERLVALNATRAAEEATGLIRWLRPEYQNKAKPVQTELSVDSPSSGGRRAVAAALLPSGKLTWPKDLPSQIRLLRDMLKDAPAPVTAEEIARSFGRVRKEKIEELLQTLVTLGQAREAGDGRFGG